MTAAQARFAFRRNVGADENFIFATWLRCYKHSSAFARRVPDKTFYLHHHAVVAGILDRAEVTVATLADSDSTIIGYSVREPGVLHFVYVKKAFRRMGVATQLLAGTDVNGCVFTHWTEGWDLLSKKWPNAQYNPYLL